MEQILTNASDSDLPYLFTSTLKIFAQILKSSLVFLNNAECKNCAVCQKASLYVSNAPILLCVLLNAQDTDIFCCVDEPMENYYI